MMRNWALCNISSKVLTGHMCFYPFSEKLQALYQFHLQYGIGLPISKWHQKTAKQH